MRGARIAGTGGTTEQTAGLGGALGRRSLVALVFFGLSCAALAPLLAGCGSQQGASSANKGDDHPQSLSADDVERAAKEANVSLDAVAAVVNAVVITWDDVDTRVTLARTSQGLTDDRSYADYLKGSGLTEADMVRQALRDLIDVVLINEAVETMGLDLDEEEVEQSIADLESRYPSHKAFVQAIEAAGYSEASYKAAVRASAAETKLREAISANVEPTDEQVQEYAVVAASGLAGKRSSQILFASNDHATAREVYQELEDGADFAECARHYSIDGSAENGGDMGWDFLNPVSTEYGAALDKLEVGEMSPIVRSRFGYHIILCTDAYEPAYTADGKVDISTMPEALLNDIKESMREELANQAYRAYLGELENHASIAVFDKDGNQVDPVEIGLTSAADGVEPISSISQALEGIAR